MVRWKKLLKNGICSIIQWINNQINGKGLFKWTNGTVYEGFYKNTKKDGEGTLTLPNGEIIKGKWSKGKLEIKK